MFPKEFVSQIRDRLNTSQVVGKRVSLKQKGKEFSGLCPFHSEKTPSFTVNDDKGFYHCFGCGAHGNVFDFVMQTEGLNFPEAIEKLALLAGMTLPKADPHMAEKYDHHAKLMQCAESAAKYFQENLKTSLGHEAREYLNRRGLSAQTIEEFRLGFAPDQSGKMQQALEKQGFKLAEMQEIGLIKNNYEMFRGRVIFPITDSKGRVIAFGGRILSKGEPKYLNSPETPIFHKRRILFGKAIARKPAYDSGNIIVTEGYMDTIALNQAGFKNTVAPLGTALSEEHLQELWALAKEPTMCFDGDSAGKRAATRAAELSLTFLKPGFSLKFVELPAGQDPDDIVRADKALFQSLVASARPLSEILYESEKAKLPAKTPEQQADLKARLDALANKIADKSIAKNYQDYFRQRIWNDFRPTTAKPEPQRSAKITQISGISAEKQKLHQLECAIIGTILTYPELLKDTIIEEDFANFTFSHLEIDKLRQNILVKSSLNVDDVRPDSELQELFRELNENIDSRLFAYINQGADFAKKSLTSKKAWENVLAQYHLELAESDFKNSDDVNDEDFEKLQEKFRQLSEERKKMNANFGD